jgi:tRNA A-37 threonylcarbamoyl transferase component Bud32
VYPPKKEPGISRQTLAKADYDFASAFILHLPEQEEPLYCEAVVRLIPGKRLVVFGQWKEQPIVAKIFFSAQAKTHLQRDAAGAQALRAAKIPTPAILYHGSCADPAISVIIFERIAPAENLDAFWQQHKSSPESEAALRSLTVEIATQHVLGLVQEDLHLKNFLLTPEKIYTLDGASIRSLPGPLSKKQSLENLALFFSQLGIQTNKLQQRLFIAYVEARSWLVEKADLQFLQKTIRQWNVKRWLSYRKKIFRSSTQFAKIKKYRRFILYNRHYHSPLFQKFIHRPDAFLAAPDTVILKAGRSSTVARITLDNRHFVVKRYNLKNPWHQLKRSLQPTRARLSWYIAHQLQFVGVPTAKPVALIENRLFGLRGKSYFVMEYIEGIRADDFFEKNPADSHSSIHAAKKIIALFFNLARLGLSHGDLKITNILFNAHQEPQLIDLDSMREHKSSLGLWHRFRKDIARFLENWQSNPAMHRLFEKLIAEMSGS